MEALRVHCNVQYLLFFQLNHVLISFCIFSFSVHAEGAQHFSLVSIYFCQNQNSFFFLQIYLEMSSGTLNSPAQPHNFLVADRSDVVEIIAALNVSGMRLKADWILTPIHSALSSLTAGFRNSFKFLGS